MGDFEKNETIDANLLVEQTKDYIKTLEQADRVKFLKELGHGGREAQQAMTPVIELVGSSYEEIDRSILCIAITDFRFIPEIAEEYKVIYQDEV